MLWIDAVNHSAANSLFRLVSTVSDFRRLFSSNQSDTDFWCLIALSTSLLLAECFHEDFRYVWDPFMQALAYMLNNLDCYAIDTAAFFYWSWSAGLLHCSILPRYFTTCSTLMFYSFQLLCIIYYQMRRLYESKVGILRFCDQVVLQRAFDA